MTRLFVDKQEIAPLPAGLNSIDQVLKLVESDHLPPNMIIREIQLDGTPLLQDELISSPPEIIDSLHRIEIFTCTLREVAIDSIREAIMYLERAESATPSLTASLRARSEEEIAASLKQFYEGFYWINLLLSRLEQSFEIPLQEVMIKGGNAQGYCLQLASLLKEVIEAHERKDFGLLGDLLEYEIIPLIPACREVFAAIRERIFSQY